MEMSPLKVGECGKGMFFALVNDSAFPQVAYKLTHKQSRGPVAALDGLTTSTNKLQTRQALYHPSTHSTQDSHISPHNTPCTTERTPTSHQESTPSKVCLVMRPLNNSYSTAHCTTTSDPDYCQLYPINTTR